MAVKQRLADVQCHRLKMEPGDRVIVKSFHRLDPEQQKKIRQSIQRWAGVEVEVLIYSTQDMELTIEKQEDWRLLL